MNESAAARHRAARRRLTLLKPCEQPPFGELSFGPVRFFVRTATRSVGDRHPSRTTPTYEASYTAIRHVQPRQTKPRTPRSIAYNPNVGSFGPRSPGHRGRATHGVRVGIAALDVGAPASQSSKSRWSETAGTGSRLLDPVPRGRRGRSRRLPPLCILLLRNDLPSGGRAVFFFGVPWAGVAGMAPQRRRPPVHPRASWWSRV